MKLVVCYLFGCGRRLVLDSLHIAKCARKKAHIYAHLKNCVKIYRFAVHFLYVWLCVWLNVSRTSAFFKTSYCYYCIVTREENNPLLYRGTKQNCCKYLRLLPSRRLIGSTCIIHTLASHKVWWFLVHWKKRKRMNILFFNANRYSYVYPLQRIGNDNITWVDNEVTFYK